MTRRIAELAEFGLITDPNLFNQEMELVREERLRRSNQQFEYVKLSLFSLTLTTIVSVFGLAAQETGVSGLMAQAEALTLPVALILTIISIVLFLLWIDDAVTISGLDEFMRYVEEEVQGEETIFYYRFREIYLNRQRAFRMKKWMYDAAIIATFFSPPILFTLFIFSFQLQGVPHWFFLAIMGIFLSFLLLPLYVWRRATKRLYGGGRQDRLEAVAEEKVPAEA